MLADPIEEALREELKEYDDLSAMLLSRRGITTKEEAALFLNPSYEEHLTDPLLIKNMRAAAERFAAAIKSGEHIAAWTDYDCDGIPAAVILHDFLKKVEANFEIYIPHRHLEGYGVNISGVEKLAERGTKLIVTADSGITDVAAVARARELGIDVIVTDHHLPGDTLPDAIVVDPNAHADETAPYKSFCGAGLAWRLVCATLAVAPELRGKVPMGWEKWLLDMAGLATIADMVPLTGENRVIASYGLLVLRKSPRIGLQKLCRAMRLEQRTISEDDVGFMIGPRVNAASRMGEALDAFKLFTTTDESEADLLAKKLEKLNRERKAQAGAITRAVHDRLKEHELKSVIALGDPEWRPALLGLVANNIAEEYDRPVFLWGREGNLSIKGSVRSGGGVHIVELMQAAEDTFAQFGGHALSGGFTVLDEAVFSLEDRLVAALGKMDHAKEAAALLRADADLDPDDATSSFLKRLERFAPFGQGNEKPLFRLRECEVAKGEIAKAAKVLVPGSRATILAHLERDQFSRRGVPRLRLVGIVPL